MLARAVLSAFSISSTAISAQELNLHQYLERLKSVPESVSDSMEFLSNMGVKLGDQGMLDLDCISSHTYYDFNNGVSRTSNRIGSFTLHYLTDGNRCVSSKIENQTLSEL